MIDLLFNALDMILALMEILIWVRVIVSWLPVPRNNQLVGMLYQLTEPLIAPVRNIIQRSAFGSAMMLDFSPAVTALLIRVFRLLLFS